MDSTIAIYTYSHLPSTQLEARHLIHKAKPYVVTADQQSQGRGRQGRQFFSQLDQGLYFSYVFDASSWPKDQVHFLTLAAGLAMATAIKDVTGKTIQLKWVNDLFYQGRKIGGILAEAVTDQDQVILIMGVGLNIAGSLDAAPQETQTIAGTLYQEPVAASLKVDLLQAWIKAFQPWQDPQTCKQIITNYSRMMLGSGSWIRYKGQAWQIRGIHPSGNLVLMNEAGQETLIDSSQAHLSSQQFLNEGQSL